MAEIGDEDVTIIPSDADSESLLPQARTSSPEPPRVIWAETGVQTIKFEDYRCGLWTLTDPGRPAESVATEQEELSPRQSPVLGPEQPSSGPPTPEESLVHDLDQPSSGPPTPQESPVHDLDQPSGPPTPQESPVHDVDQPSGPPTPQQSPVHDQEQCNNGFPASQQSPVPDPGQCSSGPLAHKESPVHGVQYSPEHVNCCSLAASPPSSSSVIPPAEPVYMTLSPSPSPPPAPASHPESGSDIDSSLFWRSCNTVGCTRAIVDGFMSGMNEIFGRVQTEQASQEDYDRALAVITASGRLAEFVDKQQKELQRKQTELQRAAEALQTVVSTLKR
ncbi:mucin-1-like [Cololabis saira]|uniref:mucin-1-like n=1 Tax=Cololabis saira TaxID=129043 RepID=UPI002AD22A73|nr:mucin-1-like [Cololabis saira]